jgi:hypothetical protein
MDNLPTHKGPTAEKLIRDRGAWMPFLPPYSPDLNPIAMAFAKLKTHLRARAVRTIDALRKAIGPICDLFQPDGCQNSFTAAAYGFKRASDALARDCDSFDSEPLNHRSYLFSACEAVIYAAPPVKAADHSATVRRMTESLGPRVTVKRVALSCLKKRTSKDFAPTRRSRNSTSGSHCGNTGST